MATRRNRDDIVRSTLAVYIGDGLKRDIIAQGQNCYSSMFLVDYTNGVVRVFIGGIDPQMGSLVSRDVFVDGFVRIYVRPLILGKFTDVTRVDYMKTTDEDFNAVVFSLGGEVSYSDYWTTPHSFYECMKLFGDGHPLLQGHLKGTFPKDNCEPRNADYLTDTYTTPLFFNRWDMGWFVTNETHVLATDGMVYWGLEQIKEHQELLPHHLHLRRTLDGPHEYVLIAESAQFFVDDNYRICKFELNA